jgi:hypothetical protein
MTTPSEGHVIDDRYRIEGPDGDGFAATDLTSGKRVHIAVVPRATIHNARRAKDLTSAHAVKVLAAGETPEGAGWVARARVSAPSLTKHLARRGGMAVTEAIEVGLALCDAIAEAETIGLSHGALDASCVYLSFSASGLVDVQVAGIGISSPARPRDDVRSIAGILVAAVGSTTLPAELSALLERTIKKPGKVLELAKALVPFALDPDFAGDRVSARRTRSTIPSSVIVDAAELPPTTVTPYPPPKRSPSFPSLKKTFSGKVDGRDAPTIIAPRPQMVQPRRSMLRALGILAAALSVALLVLIGTEGARIAHPIHRLAAGAYTAPATEVVLPPQAPIAAPIVSAAPSADVPTVRTSDLPPAKPVLKKKRN